jgi:Holliday junction DNA helicase RuvA
MIRHISGMVTDVSPTSVIIDVQGVGYHIFTTAKTGCVKNEKLTLFTHLAVRENAMDLYGFTTREELSFFELLLTLPKIGPKSALQILSQADIELLRITTLSQDATHLSKMSGIGKKTAEKIVLGLKDAFEDYANNEIAQTNVAGSENYATFASDTIDALITLGYPQSDARKAVQQLLSQKPEITKVNEAIKEVLKILG